MDSDTGFAGLAGCLSAELADEYSQKGVLAIPLSPNTRPLDQVSGCGKVGVVWISAPPISYIYADQEQT